jgi:hypothetical protein
VLKTIVHIDEKLQLLYDHIKSLEESMQLLNERVEVLEKKIKKDIKK